jgi:hypothetical protein
MGTHAAVLPQTISDPAPPAPAQQSRSTMAAEEASPPHEAGALASNVLPQTASNSAPSARYAAQVSTTMWCAVMHSIQIGLYSHCPTSCAQRPYHNELSSSCQNEVEPRNRPPEGSAHRVTIVSIDLG